MKSTLVAFVAALGAKHVAGHAMFQQLWVDGVDMASQCARVPLSNTPVTNVGGNDIRCNVGGGRGVGAKCAVKAGSIVTVEMHQQPGDRSCGNEAIGGAHYGPVIVYMSKVADSKTADGSAEFFKIYQNGWSSNGRDRGDDDNWGVKDMNKCCGKVDVKIPMQLPDGDYLLRAEVVALHAQPAQLYMTCYQLTLSRGGFGPVPAGVKFPGGYTARDPGIAANIHSKLANYIVPGPAVVGNGTEVVAGKGCSGGCEKTCTAGKGPALVLESELPAAAAAGGSAAGGAAAGVGGGAASGCTVGAWQQCGGTGYTGCTACAGDLRCDANNPYYHQCRS